MKWTIGIAISVVLWISLADAMQDFMPLDVPKTQIKKTNAKTAKKHDILPPIENGDNLTHADLEGLSDEEGDEYDEKAMSRGSITSPNQKSEIGSGKRDISDNNSGTSGSGEAEMDHEVMKFDTEAHEEPDMYDDGVQDDHETKKFDTEAHEEPDIVINDEEEGGGGMYGDGVQDEANNIADIDVNDGEEQVNTGNMRNQEELGEEVHEDD